MSAANCNHLRPGPGYWDFRCLSCDDDVSAHRCWPVRLWRRLRVPSVPASTIAAAALLLAGYILGRAS